MPQTGIEPVTYPLLRDCSANWAIEAVLVEMEGIDPSASALRTVRSTIWATSPVYVSTSGIGQRHVFSSVCGFPRNRDKRVEPKTVEFGEVGQWKNEKQATSMCTITFFVLEGRKTNNNNQLRLL